MPKLVEYFHYMKEGRYCMFASVETFHNGLGETKRWSFVDLDFLKRDWYSLKKPLIVFKMLWKTFFNDPFEKFHYCTN